MANRFSALRRHYVYRLSTAPYGVDPDRAEAAARRLGFTVLAPAADKPHGLREAFILDLDGYLWVPDLPRPH